MKSIVLNFLLLAILVLAPSLARAEGSGGGSSGAARTKNLIVTTYGGFSFGVDRGENVGTEVTRPIGVAFGVGIDYKILPQIYLNLDILHLVKGHNTYVVGETSQYNLTFVSLPLQIRYAPVSWFNFHTGPFLAALLISATQETVGQFVGVKNQFRNDFGITVGAWLGFSAGSTLSVGLDTRYDHGLANVQADGNPNTNITTRAIIMMLTLSFALN